jgi:potassium-dependent mechanosensitive channel
MSNLSEVLLGWLSLLARGPVLIQVLLVAAPLGLQHRIGHRWPVLSLMGIGLLALAGQPYGLAALLLLVCLGWWLWLPLDRLLSRWLTPIDRTHLLSRLLRPAYLLGSGLLIIDQFISLQSLGALPIGELFDDEINLGEVATAFIALYALIIGSGPLGRTLAWLLQRALGYSEGSRRATALICRYFIFGLGLVVLLSELGFNQNALLAVAGGLSIGIGFGIREVIANLISGVWLLFEGSVRPGEVLYLDGFPCEVRSLGLRATVLWRDRDNAEIVIPNQTFFTSQTTSYSAIQTGNIRLRRSEVTVQAAYRHSPRAVLALLERTALQTPRVLCEPAPKAYVLDYGESGVSYGVRFFIANPMDHSAITSAVRSAIWEALAQASIEIPYPHRVLINDTCPPLGPDYDNPTAPRQTAQPSDVSVESATNSENTNP